MDIAGDFGNKREPAIVMMGLALDVDGGGNDELIQVIVHALSLPILGGVPIGDINKSRGVHATEAKEATTWVHPSPDMNGDGPK